MDHDNKNISKCHLRLREMVKICFIADSLHMKSDCINCLRKITDSYSNIGEDPTIKNAETYI